MLNKLLAAYIGMAILCSLPGYVVAQNKPDLVVQGPFTAPTSVLTGGIYSLSAIIKNQGPNGSQFNCIGFYLSPDATWDATDAYLGASCQALLLQGQSGICSITATIPQVKPGPYHLLLVADPLNAEAEQNETNNVVALALTVGGSASSLPDLELWRPSLSFSSLPAGGNTGVFSFIYNRGEAAASAYEIGFYLSADTIFSADSDVLLGTISNSSLGGIGATGSVGVGTVFSAPVLPVPASTTPGNYYLVIMIDPRQLLAESNEQNNSRALPLRVTSRVTGTTLAAADGIRVYPNPVEHGMPLLIQLAPELAGHSLTGNLVDACGRVVSGTTMTIQGNKAHLGTQGVPTGVYALHLMGSGYRIVRRIVIK